jgi:hypothetical protein
MLDNEGVDPGVRAGRQAVVLVPEKAVGNDRNDILFE